MFFGILGLFLPVLQGVVFLVIGLVILSSEYAWAHQLLERLSRKFPTVARHVEEARKKVSRKFGSFSRQHRPD